MAYQTSLYTIFVREKEEDILVHGYTGAVDVVSHEISNFLRKRQRIETYSDDLPFSEETFKTLVNRGYLTQLNPYGERDRVQKMADLFHRRSSVKKSFLFLVAYDCNFRCPYCFENEISNNGRGWSRKTFTKDSVDRAYAAMKEIEPNDDYITKSITLYGGEPLLAKNKKIVNYIVEKGSRLGFTFSAITNGYELEEFKDLLAPDKIKRLQITVDGNKEKHNSRRTHFKDGGTFDKIIENIELALNKGVTVSVRVNVGLNNFSDIKELDAFFKQKGFFNHKKGRFSLYSALIHGVDNLKCNVVMTNDDAKEKAYLSNSKNFEPLDFGYYDPDSQYINFNAEQVRHEKPDKELVFHDEENAVNDQERIRSINRAKYIDMHIKQKDDHNLSSSCQDFGIRNKIMRAVKGESSLNFKSTFCGAQNGMLIFDPCGDLYTCWEIVGVEKYKVGTYKKSVEFDEEELNRWFGKNIGKTNACSKCKYAFFCGGGCMVQAIKEGRGHNSPYCDGLPKTFHAVVKDVYHKKIKEQQVPVLVDSN